MTTMSLVTGADQLIRVDAMRRKNAEIAYTSSDKYSDDLESKLAKIERMLIGDEEKENNEENLKKEELNAGQMKAISLPVGKSLLETIDIWRNVRSDVFVKTKKTPNDYHLAHTASSEIRDAEATLMLQKTELTKEQNPNSQERSYEPFQLFNVTHSKKMQEIQFQKKFAQAASSYLFHVNMLKGNFSMEVPTFYESV